MKLKPNIAICIPTFNRSDLLIDALRSIESNSAGRDDIEVIISDNASNDNTRSVVASFQDRMSRIKYYRNEKNIGPVRNLRLSISYAKAEFIWILADDDVLTDGAVNRLLGFLSDNPGVDYIFYSREIVDFNLNPTAAGVQPTGLRSDRVFSDGNELFCSCDGQMPYILGFFSSTIIRRSIWEKSVAETQVFSDDYAWDHLFVILKAIRNRSCAIISTAGVKARLNYRPVKTSSKIGFDDSIRMLIDIRELGYSSEVIHSTIKEIIKLESKSFVIDKAKGERTDNIFNCLNKLNAGGFQSVSPVWGVLSLLPGRVLYLPWLVFSALIQRKRETG